MLSRYPYLLTSRLTTGSRQPAAKALGQLGQPYRPRPTVLSCARQHAGLRRRQDRARLARRRRRLRCWRGACSREVLPGPARNGHRQKHLEARYGPLAARCQRGRLLRLLRRQLEGWSGRTESLRGFHLRAHPVRRGRLLPEGQRPNLTRWAQGLSQRVDAPASAAGPAVGPPRPSCPDPTSLHATARQVSVLQPEAGT